MKGSHFYTLCIVLLARSLVSAAPTTSETTSSDCISRIKADIQSMIKSGRSPCNATLNSIHDAISTNGCPAFDSDPKDKSFSNWRNSRDGYLPIFYETCWAPCNATIYHNYQSVLRDNPQMSGYSGFKRAFEQALTSDACPRSLLNPAQSTESLLNGEEFGYQDLHSYFYTFGDVSFRIGAKYYAMVEINANENKHRACMFKCDQCSTPGSCKMPAYQALTEILKEEINNGNYPSSSFGEIENIVFYGNITEAYCKDSVQIGTLELTSANGTVCERAIKAHQHAISKGHCPPGPVSPWKGSEDKSQTDKKYSFFNVRWYRESIYQKYCDDYLYSIGPLVQAASKSDSQADGANYCADFVTALNTGIQKHKIPGGPKDSNPAYNTDYGYGNLYSTYCYSTCNRFVDLLVTRFISSGRYSSNAASAVQRALIDGVSSGRCVNPSQANMPIWEDDSYPMFYKTLYETQMQTVCLSRVNQTMSQIMTASSGLSGSTGQCTALKQAIAKNIENRNCLASATNSKELVFPASCVLLEYHCADPLDPILRQCHSDEKQISAMGLIHSGFALGQKHAEYLTSASGQLKSQSTSEPSNVPLIDLSKGTNDWFHSWWELVLNSRNVSKLEPSSRPLYSWEGLYLTNPLNEDWSTLDPELGSKYDFVGVIQLRNHIVKSDISQRIQLWNNNMQAYQNNSHPFSRYKFKILDSYLEGVRALGHSPTFTSSHGDLLSYDTIRDALKKPQEDEVTKIVLAIVQPLFNLMFMMMLHLPVPY